jgi:hypothetical protein
VKSVKDRGTVGPGMLPGTQAGLREDIMPWFASQGVGHLRGTSVPREESGEEKEVQRGWASANSLSSPWDP